MINYRVRRIELDVPRVLRRTDAAARRVLMRAGAFVRRSARTSIRKPTKVSREKKWKNLLLNETDPTVSKPGKPPKDQTGRLKRAILFAYSDKPQHNVVIGPQNVGSGTDAPQRLEFGGSVTVRRKGGFFGGKTIRLTYEPRPFMGPALEKNVDKFAEMWRDSVR